MKTLCPKPLDEYDIGVAIGARSPDRTDDLSLTRRALLPAELCGRIVCLHDVAGIAGLEPTTSGFGDRRSAN